MWIADVDRYESVALSVMHHRERYQSKFEKLEARKLFDPWSLLLGLVFGSIGLGYFIYGKKQANAVVRYSGLVLMVYPYFIENKFAVLGVGVVIMALPKFIEL